MKKVGFIFAGQGSQSKGMGEDFYNSSDVAKELIESASDRLSLDFKKLMFEENEQLAQTEFTQPSILLVSAIAHKLFDDETGLKPVFSMGHSLGEFSALTSVGALDIIDGVELTHNRGKFMAQACDGVGAGMMVLLGLSDEQVEGMTAEAQADGKKIWAANYNSDGQIVVAGIKDDLAAMEQTFKDAGAKRAMLLNMSVASHCPLLDSAVPKLDEYLQKMLKDDFRAPVISNVTANKYSSKAEALTLLGDQLVKPVKYKQSIEAYESDVDMFIEFGNGAVLKGINKKLTKVPTVSVNSMASLEEVINSLQ
jgi:[acyl-carrier-protein] S-malonyltransferase